jgi:lipopolysaccharide export system ATP-binding protein
VGESIWPEVAARTEFGSLVAESVSFAIGKQPILSDISVQLAGNEIVGLLGRDGSGKTCLFELLAGLVAPSSGQIILNGVDATGWTVERRARHGLEYLPEEPSIFRELTVEQNIEVALSVSRRDSAARSAGLEKLLDDFQLKRVRAQSANSLSGGERRRCEVARALAAHPAILMLDEPFRGLDPMSVSGVTRAVASLRESGVGVLISDYDLHDLIGLIDRAYLLHEGRIIFSGTAEELMDDPAVRRCYLGESFAL